MSLKNNNFGWESKTNNIKEEINCKRYESSYVTSHEPDIQIKKSIDSDGILLEDKKKVKPIQKDQSTQSDGQVWCQEGICNQEPISHQIMKKEPSNKYLMTEEIKHEYDISVKDEPFESADEYVLNFNETDVQDLSSSNPFGLVSIKTEIEVPKAIFDSDLQKIEVTVKKADDESVKQETLIEKEAIIHTEKADISSRNIQNTSRRTPPNIDLQATALQRSNFESSKARKRKFKTKSDHHIAKAFDILQTFAQRDACEVYGEHIAMKLRTYSKRTQSVVQHLLNNILFNADIGQYDQEVNVNASHSNARDNNDWFTYRTSTSCT